MAVRFSFPELQIEPQLLCLGFYELCNSPTLRISLNNLWLHTVKVVCLQAFILWNVFFFQSWFSQVFWQTQVLFPWGSGSCKGVLSIQRFPPGSTRGSRLVFKIKEHVRKSNRCWHYVFSCAQKWLPLWKIHPADNAPNGLAELGCATAISSTCCTVNTAIQALVCNSLTVRIHMYSHCK